MTQTSDETLLKQYANSDFAAFEQLYARHKGGLFRYLLRQVHNKTVVEDIFQEVWGKVISHAANYQESATFKTWLYTIARNKVIDHVRHLKVLEHVIESPFRQVSNNDSVQQVDEFNEQHSSTKEAPETRHKQMLHAQAIEHCLQKLPKHQLDCFLLREEAGFTAKAIAELMSVTMEATKSRLKASYKSLRACLSLKLDIDPSQNSGIDRGITNE